MTGHRCRWCGGPHGVVVLDLGQQVPSDAFPLPGDPAPGRRPLRLWRCDRCGLAQLPDGSPTPDEPRAVEPEALVQHARACVEQGLAAGWLRPGDSVVEFGSPHGGSWSDHLVGAGLRPVATGPADVVVDVFGLMHDEDLATATRLRVAGVRPGGVLALVFPPLETVVAHGQWNAVRHGHHTYPSTAFTAAGLAGSGCAVTAVSRHPLYGGTTLLVARRGGAPGEVELPAEVTTEALVGLADRVQGETTALRAFLQSAVDAGRPVLAYGAASRAVPLLLAAEVGRALLPAVADASLAKQGRLVPGTDIPVVAPDALVAAAPDQVLLLLPDLLAEVRQALPEIEAQGGAWVSVDDVLHGGGG